MTDKIVIVGAGYTGLRLAEAAVDEDYEVVGTTRSEETLEALGEMGAEGVRWDVNQIDESPFEEHLEEGCAVVYSVPTLFRNYGDPGPGGRGPMARHVRPLVRVLRSAAEAGASRFIYLSSTSVYGNHDGARVDEETPTDPTSPAGKMRRDIERWVMGQGETLDVNVARLVGIYGPGRTMADYIERGLYKLVDGGTKPTNRIHVDDIVGALLTMIEEGPAGARLYNVSDGHPKTAAEVVDWLVERLDLERPEEISMEAYAEKRGPNAVARWKNTYRVDNSRLTEELGYELKYPDVFAGLEAIYG